MLDMYNDKSTFVWTCSIILFFFFFKSRATNTSKDNARVIDLSSLKVNVTKVQGSGQRDTHTSVM